MATLAELLRQGADRLINLPSEAQRFVTNPQAFTQLLTGKNPLPRETGFAAGATGLPPTEMSVLDPNQAAYMQGYSQGEPIGYAGMAAPFAAPAAFATGKALAPKLGQMTENYMVKQGMMPSIVPQSADNAITSAERMKIAQKNAALPVSEGGLGLPANNTANQRAQALGFTDEVYHGTNADIYAFDPMMADTRRRTGTPMGAIVVSSNPKTASTYAGEKPTEWIKAYEEGGNVMPLLINKGKNMSMNATQQGYTPNWKEIYNPKYPDVETTNDFAVIAKQKGKQSATIKNVKDNAVMSGAEGDTTFIFDPSLIRSRFAAFDPKRRKEADLLAGGLAIPIVDEDNRKAMLEKLFNSQ